ncbi:DNA-binding protein [Paenibacillus sp. TAB 01]|uniref:DNA-binding protein n=1 Tax=Paenibacillus sp. TAB 01 TaxID=3368988 RepID=UPI0037527E6A
MSETNSGIPLIKFEMDMTQLRKAINEAVDQALERHSLAGSLPPVLNREQLMKFLDIKSTKASELMNRRDFPVIRELGHPKILTHLLMKWLEDHTEWVTENAGSGYKQVV